MKKIKLLLLFVAIAIGNAYSLTVNVSTEIELQNAINKHFGTKDIVSEINVAKDIPLTKEIDIPVLSTRQTFKGLIINLCGNTIYDNSGMGLKYLIGRIPKNQSEAILATTWSLSIYNGALKGKRLNYRNWTGSLLVLGSTYNSIVENIQMTSAIDGIEFRFCLMGRIQNVLCNGVDSTAIYVGRGNWDGAGNNTSQSNGTVVDQVRIFNNAGATAFMVESSSMITISNCISEGNEARYHLLWIDSPTTTTVQDGTVENFYIEAPGTIKIQTKAGHKVLKNIWMQNPTKFEFEALAAVATIYMINIPYWPTGSKFQLIGSSANLALRAEEVAVDIRNNELWVGSETVFPKLSTEIKGMPRYISFNSSILNKSSSNTDLRLNGLLVGHSAPLNIKTGIPIVSKAGSISGSGNSGNNDGGMFIYKRGIVVKSGIGNPTIDTNDFMFIDAKNGEGAFNYEVSNLAPGKYTIRAFAYNGKGTSYGEAQTVNVQ